ncbi:exodeoxyribonuclease V subunit alpha [Motilibacter aurantiacus]|uniref:exodeoxyribonuclease V subunit alpha n=1 Tax=Motilibacter aurantiacus TaxID=2714955 RepID=UPI001409699A|nr:exodeoxyribonuclease V subunit alpha [Motilibacter aurantiacus]NHC47605.1 exodeoxyribonuclease V subunit alpha [Motilibacter aurantiacus]
MSIAAGSAVPDDTLDTAAVEPYDARLALRADGVLRTFNVAGVLHAADVHVATTLGRLGGEERPDVLLAAALAVRAVRHGSVCVDLATVRHTAVVDGVGREAVEALPWPEPATWLPRVADGPLVAGDGSPAGEAEDARPLRLDGGLLYLDRYWRQEQLVRHELRAREELPPPEVDPDRLAAAVGRLFPAEPDGRGLQHVAGSTAARRWVTVIAGGPGTGKTTTVARVLALLQDLHRRPGTDGLALRVALAAPTGKAAARLEEAVRAVGETFTGADRSAVAGLSASTLHRLLGRRRDSRTRFRHDRANRLPFDVVVVDETSMVSLTMMARLLEALRPDARLVLVGDPDQLASVEAGAVLGDLVHRSAADGTGPDNVVVLRHTYRFGGGIAELARAVQAGDAETALGLLRAGSEQLTFSEQAADVPPSAGAADRLRRDVLSAGRATVEAARRGEVAAALHALDAHRLLCAHREGPYGVDHWSGVVERWLVEAVAGYAAEGEWYVGRPLLVTANDYETALYNGDTGVVVRADGDVPRAAFARGGGPVLVPPSRLAAVQTVHAMTVHKSQGSQFDAVSLILPPPDSPLLTRELVYTAVTRARSRVHVLGSADAVRAALARPVARASGLRRG